MATEQKLTFLIEAKNMATEAINNVSKSLDGLKDKNGSLVSSIEKIGIASGVVFGALALYTRGAIKGAIEQETQQTRLRNVMQTSTNATNEQVKSLIDQAEALEEVGVVSAGTITQLQGQLGSFSLTTDAIKALTPALLDYTVFEKGLNATTQDAQAIANGFAQAMQGNFSALTKSGFILDDNTKKMISNGNEMERTKALVDVLNSNYKGYNEQMRQTTEGGIIGMQFQLNKLNDAIGGAFIPVVKELNNTLTPVLKSFADWANANPELASKMLIVVMTITGLLATLAVFVAIAPTIALAWSIMMGPVGWVMLLITGLVGAIYYLYTNWDQIMKDLLLIWEAFKEGLKVILFAIQNEWIRWVNYLSMKYNLFITEIKAMWDSIKDYFVNVLNTIKSAWDTVWSGAKQSVIDVWEGIKSTIGEGIAWIETQIQKITNAFNSIKNSVSSAMASSATTTTAAYGGGGPGLISYFRATGGQVNPSQSYIVGENGPELFSPSSFGSISKAGSFGGTPIIINISNNSFLGKEGIAEEIGNGLMNILKQNIKLV